MGITGPINHGKTAFGQALQRLEPKSVHYESAWVISSLAEAWLASVSTLPAPDDIPAINAWIQQLIPMLNKDFGVECTYLQVKIDPVDVAQKPDNYQKLFDFLAQPPSSYTNINEESKSYFRPLLQWIGGYFVAKVDFGIWYKQILLNIQKDAAVGIDLAVVGGLRYRQDAAILKSAGATIVSIERPGLPIADADDPTERERLSIPVDIDVINNGNLIDLENCAARLYQDLQSATPQRTYVAIEE